MIRNINLSPQGFSFIIFVADLRISGGSAEELFQRIYFIQGEVLEHFDHTRLDYDLSLQIYNFVIIY